MYFIGRPQHNYWQQLMQWLRVLLQKVGVGFSPWPFSYNEKILKCWQSVGMLKVAKVILIYINYSLLQATANRTT